jgi:dihydroorotase
MQRLELPQADDWHAHLRDDEFLTRTVRDTASQFARAIIMPNLNPPVITVEQALAYRDRILAALEPGQTFTPLMTLYLSAQTTREELKKASEHPDIFACKLYPAGATTYSDAGIADIKQHYHLFEAMEAYDIPLLIHSEVNRPDADIFDREKLFIDEQLIPLTAAFPNCRIVMEHVSTKDGVDFVNSASDKVAATITCHHCLLTRNDLLAGGIKPHYYCLPVVKTDADRQALVDAATSGNRKFFVGTDSAPHTQHSKESPCGCAGIYTAPVALSLYTQIFEDAGKLEHLAAFLSENGPDFYRLPRNQDTMIMEAKPWDVPASLPYGEHSIIPFYAGQSLKWQKTSA